MCRVSSARTTSAVAQLVQYPQRDVVEVSDRRRADRERHYAGPPRTRRAPRRSGPPSAPSSARGSRLSPPGASASRRTAGRAAGSRRSKAATPNPPPITTSCGFEDVDERADRHAEVVADLAERAVALASLQVVRRCASGAEHAPREPVDRDAGAVRLDVPAPGARAVARRRRPRRSRCGRARPSRGRAAAVDDAAADAGAEREHHEVSTPRPAPSRNSAYAAPLASFSSADGQPEPLAPSPRGADLVQRDVDRTERDARSRWSTRDGIAEADRRDPVRPAARATAATSSSSSAVLRGRGRRPLDRLVTRSRRASTTPARIFVPPRSTPITRFAAHVGWVT